MTLLKFKYYFVNNNHVLQLEKICLFKKIYKKEMLKFE